MVGTDDPPLWRLGGVGLPGRPRPRLDGVDLEIRPGLTAVAGPSGSGKSSLLEVLAGFVRPSSGRVESRPDAGTAACYWVPAGLGLWDHLDVRRHLAGVTEDRERIAEVLAWCELEPLVRRRPPTLSQGERTRLAMARAFAVRPPVLLLDEALTNLHRDLADRIWERLVTECRAEKRSLVFVTHQVERILADADRTCFLDGGRVVCSAPTDSLYRDPPDAGVARFFGPCNWLSQVERDRWLDGAPGPCVRPERLELAPDPEGGGLVEASTGQGPFARTRLRGADGTGEVSLVHRHGVRPLTAGMRVALRLLAVLALLLPIVGCGQQGTQLTFKRVRSLALSTAASQRPKPRALHATDERIYCLDTAGRIVIHDRRGREVAVWEMPDHAVGNPEGIIELADGRVAVADTHYNRVVLFAHDGELLGTIGGPGEGPGEFGYPVALAEDADGNLYVGEYGGNDRVQVFAPDGDFVRAFGRQGLAPGEFQRPGGIVCHGEDVYVVDAFNNRIQRFSREGEFEGIFAPEVDLNFPYDCCIDAVDALWVVEYGAARLSRFDLDGSLLGRYGRPGRDREGMRTPWALTVLPSGEVWVADTGNARIVRLTP